MESAVYVRFIVLTAGRTGSTWLRQALNSHSEIVCFGDVFKVTVGRVGFGVDGYDDFSTRDQALRGRDFRAFLRGRIHCRHPEEIGAVGFKLLYRHPWGYPGLLEHLVEDRQMRVLHLRRRNIIQRLVSQKLAHATDVWTEMPRPGLTLVRLLVAARHPLRVATKLPRLIRPAKPRQKAPGLRVSVSKDELFRSIIGAKLTAARFDDLFRDHPIQTLYYEDLVDDREEVFRQAQEFLGVEPGPLKVTLRKQNPEPLPELLENYDELYRAFCFTPHAWMFD